jgi:hypothetical protein
MQEIYRIVDRGTDKEVGVYTQPTARDEYNFGSVEAARKSNCHGIYEDKTKYKIRKYKLVLVDDDCDPPTEDDLRRDEIRKKLMEELRKRKEELSLKMYGVSYTALTINEMLTVDVAAIMVRTDEKED